MFQLLKIAVQVLLKPYKITDAESFRAFLRELVLLLKPLAAQTENKLDDMVLKHVEYVLSNDALFDYLYRQIVGQIQTEEIIFESVDETLIRELCNFAGSKDHPTASRVHKKRKTTEDCPVAINPALIISLVTQIISIINAMKDK